MILLKNIDEIYTNSDKEVIKNGYIIIEDNFIKELGEKEEFKSNEYKFDGVIDGKGKIALPGFINSHTHAGMTLLRGYADDLPLQLWLEEEIWPFEAGLSADDIYWGTMLAILEMIKKGTTTFTDMYFQMGRVAEAVKETGIRAVLTQGLIEANDKYEGLVEAVRFCQDWHGKASGRITTMMAPHAPYTCSTEYLQEIIRVSCENNLAINIHVAETRQELEESKEKKGLSPVKYLDKIGLFKQPVIAAHCVYVDKEDIKILADKDVGVAYNPESNMKLGSGIAPVAQMLEAGINVGLGTDGVSSNNNLDLIEEARVGSYLQKVDSFDPTALDTFDLLKMISLYGARALRIDNLGILREGFMADVVLIDIEISPHYYPHHNNLSNLFYAGNGGDVSDVIINGQIIMENKNLLTIDEEKIYYKVEDLIDNL